MKNHVSNIILGTLILAPLLISYPFLDKLGWQPAAYMVSFPGLFSLLGGAITLLIIFHYYIFKNHDGQSYPQQLKRNIFWIWTGPLFLLMPIAAKRREKHFAKSAKHKAHYYFFTDFLLLCVYVLSMISLTLLGYEPVKNRMLYEYKKRHIAKEKMYYKEGWGWVDKIHYRDDHFLEVYEAIKKGDKQIKLHDGWITPLRFPVHFSVIYEFGATDSELDQWAIATAITTHFMEENERVQGNSPWYHGNQLSAWQFDDVSSGLLACLELCPNKQLRPSGKNIKNQNELQSQWKGEGRKWVKVKMTLEESWKLNKAKKLKNLVANAKWKVLETKSSHD